MYREDFLKRVQAISFSNIFIIADRNYWELCKEKCVKETDLVFCLDFGLKKMLEDDGYLVTYADFFQPNKRLDPLNIKMHDFLSNWYRNKDGQPLLTYKGYSIGDALLLNVLTDVTYFCHFFFNFTLIKELKFDLIIAALPDDILLIFEHTGIPYLSVRGKKVDTYSSYWFPITKWMKEKQQIKSINRKLKEAFAYAIDVVKQIIDPLFSFNGNSIFVSTHHNTIPIIQKLVNYKDITVYNENYSSIKKIFTERRIFYRNYEVDKKLVKEYVERFKINPKYIWEYKGYNISEILYGLIYPIVESEIPNAIRKVKSIEKYFSNRKLDLMIPVTDLWINNRLLMQYCFRNQIPVFMIINGLLNLPFWTDAKDSDWINCYSKSIREYYYSGAANAIPLGDPRMDGYAKELPKSINRVNPTIIIGSSGFGLLDLNSFLAVEFDFLSGIYNSLLYLKESGVVFNLILKARSNSYIHLYREFINEYFPAIETTILQEERFDKVIRKADLYITFYSQTVFEASCIGIPVIYFKNDGQSIDPPFDGKSELVTANNSKELSNFINLFLEGSDIFEPFLQKKVMEKYIGPLDGQNTEKNIEFIYSLLSNETEQIKKKI